MIRFGFASRKSSRKRAQYYYIWAQFDYVSQTKVIKKVIQKWRHQKPMRTKT